VDQSPWQGSGPEFSLTWGSRQWILKLNEACPGLCLDQPANPAKLLALDWLAAPARCDFDAFNPSTLVEYERYRQSVRASFAPPSWSGLRVRASWWSTSPFVVDMEVQVTASSVGELEGLEVGVVSRLESGARSQDIPFESPGRLTGPNVFPSPDGLDYAEMAHPDDVAERGLSQAHFERSPPEGGRSVRYALFGLALEKGVVLRARLRGCWLQSRNLDQAAHALYQEFLREPPPLGP
jgi:hypothetical protein